MANDVRLEIEDIDTGAQLTLTGYEGGVSITIEDDNSSVSLNLDPQHAALLASVVTQIVDSDVSLILED